MTWPTKEVIEAGYLTRYWLLRTRSLTIYLHVFTGSDDDRALHDHVGDSVSFLLWGEVEELYDEHPEQAPYGNIERWRKVPWLWPVYRKAETAHRLELWSKRAITLWFRGPIRRKWGFWVNRRWVHWREYLASRSA